MNKIVFDGALFSECQMQGRNRYGMLRVAEEITIRLLNIDEFEFAFANSIYLEKYHLSLIQFLQDNFSSHQLSILSKKPNAIFNILEYKRIFQKLPWLLFPNVKNAGIEEYDIYHSFYYPINKNVQQLPLKKCITFLDIIPLRLEGYTKEIINLTQRIVDSIQENYAISISEYSKQDLLNYNKHIKSENIFVAPLAASPSTFYQNKNVADLQRVQKKYNLPTNYFLCISSSDIRKNIEHLIICFSQFILQEKPKDAYLVIAGNSTHSRTVLDKLNIDKEVRKRIVFPEKFIDENDLAIVYSNALSFFFMSLYEGFGLPALEAMQCGTPTVAANTSSIPEVMGDAGILLSPTDKNSLCETMLQLYNNESLRLNLSQKGIQQASLFSWERTANEYSSIFKMINNI